MYFRSNRGTPEPDSLSYQGEDETTGGAERHVQKQKIFILQSLGLNKNTMRASHDGARFSIIFYGIYSFYQDGEQYCCNCKLLKPQR